MEDADRHLETAITALKASRDAIRDAQDPEPADLSSTVAMVRELAWNLDSVVKRVAERYNKLGPVGHDHGDDPARCVEMIRLRLEARRDGSCGEVTCSGGPGWRLGLR